ncbi:PLP-dependent aminotransferase family protein [uncultured Hoeflea sp.]|mgnify:CR=1 FL=1|uniref:MocR-like ectoine utilization transcription factor EhuR n=1 Tax=uncultured Hoeflea sp. TaxID=538666 RepID=UPI0030EF1B24|tara:strand:- start:72903 stop:74291 length:1389 start_codon:yes stop_codon:yes gene_type:complete
MTIWPPKSGELRRPAYKSLADTLVRAVDAGELRSGDRLPTHRNLAYDLGLSVQTVSRAYDELIRRGVIAGEVGRGTFVRAGRSDTKTPFVPDSQNEKFIDFSILMPVFEAMHLAEMQRALTQLGADLPSSTISAFRPSTALKKYTSAATKWLEGCGLDPSAQGLLMTNGNTSAMTIALMTVANSGDLIVTEELAHHTLKALSRYLGLRIQGLETDAEGVVPAAFGAACQRSQVKAIYLMPSGLNPRAVMMSTERRAELVAVARRYDVLIIENDAWGPLQPDRPAPVAAIAAERTFYFTSLTKCIMPGLRFGFLTMPEAFESAAANRHLVTNWMATPLMAEIGCRWIEDGTADRLLNWQKDALGKRNEVAAKVLSGIPFQSSPNGMHVWLPAPGAWTEEEFVAQARLNGVAVAPGSAFAMSDNVRKQGVRICLGAETSRTLQRGLNVIARLARSKPEPALLTL